MPAVSFVQQAKCIININKNLILQKHKKVAQEMGLQEI
jgi:hypothetical protein